MDKHKVTKKESFIGMDNIAQSYKEISVYFYLLFL
jgi:hypothetical protein